MKEGDCYRLVRGDDILGIVTCTSAQYPWYTGKFEPSAAYAPVQPLFTRAFELLQAEALEEWSAAYAAVADVGLSLEPTDGGPAVTDMTFHISGDEASWRS